MKKSIAKYKKSIYNKEVSFEKEMSICARLAQLVEHPAVNRQVVGPSPTSSAIFFGQLVKWLNTPPFHGGIHGSESRTGHQRRNSVVCQRFFYFKYDLV